MIETEASLTRRKRLMASPRMFQNPLLDRLSRVHPAVPVILYIPLILALLVLGRSVGIVPSLLWCGLGYAVWTLVEYWGHRILFHYNPGHGLGARLHWMIHGVHHDHPSDPLRLVMPPLMSLPIMLIAFGVGHVIADAPALYPLLAGFMTGYLAYDMVHYAVHHFQPRTAWGRKLRRLHMMHHFQDHTCSFGVSAPWWDWVFGTSYQHRSRNTPARMS